MAGKHVCKHCGTPRSGHDCPVASRRIEKRSDDDFVIMTLTDAERALVGEATETAGRLLPADPPPSNFGDFDFGYIGDSNDGN